MDGISSEMQKMYGEIIVQSLQRLFENFISVGNMLETLKMQFYNFTRREISWISKIKDSSVSWHQQVAKEKTKKQINRETRYLPTSGTGRLNKGIQPYGANRACLFIDFCKVFHTIETWDAMRALVIARINSRYSSLLKNMYQTASLCVQIYEDLETQ